MGARRHSQTYTFFTGKHAGSGSPRRITLSSREDHKPLPGSRGHFLQPPDLKPSPSTFSFSPPSSRPCLYQMNLNCKLYPTNLKSEVTPFPDLSIEEFSDMSGS